MAQKKELGGDATAVPGIGNVGAWYALIRAAPTWDAILEIKSPFISAYARAKGLAEPLNNPTDKDNARSQWSRCVLVFFLITHHAPSPPSTTSARSMHRPMLLPFFFVSHGALMDA